MPEKMGTPAMHDAPDADRWSVEWWKWRHDISYFPAMEQHKDWKVYGEEDLWFLPRLELTGSEKVLEIGCGYGQWMIPLSKHCGMVVGVDLHPSLWHKASEKFRDHLGDDHNCSMLLSNGRSLPFEDDQFQRVYCISVFQHITRSLVKGYLKETTRVLKPGGLALFHFLSDQCGLDYDKDIVKDHQGTFSVGWSDKEIDEACKEAGLDPSTDNQFRYYSATVARKPK